MSAVQRLPLKIQGAFEELLEIQRIRLKAKMEGKIHIGNGVTKFFVCNDEVFEQYAGNIYLENIEGNFCLVINNSRGLLACTLPCHQILFYSCVNATVTFHLAEEYFAKKCVLQLSNSEQVEMIISRVKPRETPRPNTYQNDGNVTSSDTDPDDSSRGKTEGIDNTFESDSPSDHE